MSLAQPHSGITVVAPLVAPAPGQVVVRYDIVEYEAGCCKCGGLTGFGLFWVVVLVLICFPLAFIPCCMPSCNEKKQRPFYDYPTAMTAAPPAHYAVPIPVAPAPVAAYPVYPPAVMPKPADM
ncbi:hypothetical protein CEUSTIGMA_g5940.t1 [Chlamydomonas eustigma]|uniref:Uncharacterized protein n=1 Tax=Chlamydomonas eustigma TaxID=1157962 RepID=A0A250X5Z6_9CHLO|nr:hypothetical protein CEUSTIGMA_g5940.t1 [Chlamydomonas eustigma]|eukprot:GAX78501.1 hypothetical protein CEUSTIGMA_g5940.t1 [Chlamydomonas eustigma]